MALPASEISDAAAAGHQPEVVYEPDPSTSAETLGVNATPNLAVPLRGSYTEEPQPDSNHIHISELPPDKSSIEAGAKPPQNQPQGFSSPYTIPPWSGPPCHPYYLEVLKDGSISDQLNVSEKGAYMFGRVNLCDFVLEHPSISRFHAVFQFKRNGQAYLYDLGSTHGTFVNKNQVNKKIYVELHVGDVIRLGQSSRLYIFQGPGDLMPPEVDLECIRNVKVRQEMQDREASLLRAKRLACVADGISWGMGEDAIEEAEDEVDEVTWQTYKGQLTEKQEKTRDKVLKRYEKIAHMKKEISAIRAKDIPQGGLTQGQQTQIARNEQRISEIAEELENLEETLNESIRESLGARLGKASRNRKAAAEDDDEFASDDDEFYDRTQKKKSNKKSAGMVETADSLLDKKETIIKDIESKRKLLFAESSNESKAEVKEAETGDVLDAFMSGVSSQLVMDKASRIQMEISALQSELDRIVSLQKIADPTGEAARKRDSKVREGNLMSLEHGQKPRDPRADKNQICVDSSMAQCKSGVHLGKVVNASAEKHETPDAISGSVKKPAEDATESKPTPYTEAKPQWLGAIDDTEEKVMNGQRELELDYREGGEFVDYKDRKKILAGSLIEDAAPGLIIRKRKQATEGEPGNDEALGSPVSSSSRAQAMAEDAVALLLKHSGGVNGSDDRSGEMDGSEKGEEGQLGIGVKKPKRVLGPERPPFLDRNPDFESWVPPEGQSGDGKTSLNERYGY